MNIHGDLISNFRFTSYVQWPSDLKDQREEEE
jgi:hypothetical protein